MPNHRPEPADPALSAGATPATDHVRSEENNLTFLLGEWGFKILFGFLGIIATTLSLLSPSRREPS